MMKGRNLKLAAAAVTVVSAFGLSGLSATSASAATSYHVCLVNPNPIDGNPSHVWCIDATPHNVNYQISYDHTRAAVGFVGPYHLSGDSTDWWELTTGNNLCLAADPHTNGWLVYAESCQPTDHYEWWDNHPGYQFENAAGNLHFQTDAWLAPVFETASDAWRLGLIVGSGQPFPWSEPALP